MRRPTAVCTKCGKSCPLAEYWIAHRAKRLQRRSSWCKACRTLHVRMWKRKNPELDRARQREQYWKDPETSRANARDRGRRKKAARPDHYRELRERWLEAGGLEWCRRWRASSRGQASRRAAHCNRRARDPELGKVRAEDWAAILEMYDGRCAYCGQPASDLTADHVVSLHRRGPNHPSNVVPACKRCNSVKAHRPVFVMLNPEALWAKGWER